jgi:hypothetical protein
MRADKQEGVMEAADREKLIERIRKLLALADNNPSESEAAAALERASAIMAEHNLTMAHVDALGTGDERIEERFDSENRRQTWARLIWSAVSELNFCMHYYYTYQREGEFPRLRLTPDGKYERIPLREVDQRFVMGTRANVESTKAMATYLVHAVERLAGGPEYGARERHAFKLGCADRLAQRLGDLKWERTRAKQQPTAGGSNLPALRDVYTAHEIANQEFYAKLHGKPPKFGCGSALGRL